MATFGPLLVRFGLIASALAQACWRNATCTPPTEASFPGPWDENIYAPDSRTVRPRSVLSLSTGEPLAPFSSSSSSSSCTSPTARSGTAARAGTRTTRATLKPAFGEVSEAQAGFTTALGRFRGGVAAIEWHVPVGTRGWLELGGEEGEVGGRR
ncbi:hypothetical protein LX32DRAFT_694379 [Colletotrichum zoysiae]|uniref:Uncharacterized protein n=1 Tax=Colletotrichum zoysiae TaxID=1216348 RepID=A0AAD9HHN3_9PEZI|nr:hypothetical protein LX32DRAFT_694379 [Colletotrichum zoysiae]